MPGTQTPDSTSDFFVAVTPNDSADLTNGECRALYIGGAGNIVIRNKDATSITFTAVTAGSILPCRTSRVLSTSTTATSIVALY